MSVETLHEKSTNLVVEKGKRRRKLRVTAEGKSVGHAGPACARLRARVGRNFVKQIIFFLCFVATQLARQLQQERLQVVCSNKEARKHLARRHSRNSCHVFVCIVLCACSRHPLDFEMLFFIPFGITATA